MGIHDTLQAKRSHWQRWHVEAEALRQVRTTDLDTVDIDRVVGLLVDEVLTRHSVPLTRPGEDIGEDMGDDINADVKVPSVLRRSDGSSVYTVAGSALFTSRAPLAAEARIVSRAGQLDGVRVPTRAVDLAMLASTANGLPLNAGQATLVREIATSRARPARDRPRRRRQDHRQAGTGPGLGRERRRGRRVRPLRGRGQRPRREHRATTDTMAKLIWHLDHPALLDLPEWAQKIGPSTLVVVDEAGMADTLSLDKVIEFVVSRGGRLHRVVPGPRCRTRRDHAGTHPRPGLRAQPARPAPRSRHHHRHQVRSRPAHRHLGRRQPRLRR